MLAQNPFANYSLITRRRTAAAILICVDWRTPIRGAEHADLAQSAFRRDPAYLGHAHRPYRHPAGLRFQLAPSHRAEHVQALAGVYRRYPGDCHGAEQQRHGDAGDVLCRPGLDGADARPGDDARRRRRYGADGEGADVRLVLAIATADLSRGDFLPVAQTDAGRAVGTRGDRPRADHSRAATHRRSRWAYHPCPGRQGAVRFLDRRHPARRLGRRLIRDDLLLQPGRRPTDRHPGRRRCDRLARSHRPGDRRQYRQRCAGLPQHQHAERRRSPSRAG